MKFKLPKVNLPKVGGSKELSKFKKSASAAKKTNAAAADKKKAGKKAAAGAALSGVGDAIKNATADRSDRSVKQAPALKKLGGTKISTTGKFNGAYGGGN